MGGESGESVAGEGNEEMAMGGVTVGNRTGMVGTGAESQAADGGLVLRRGGAARRNLFQLLRLRCLRR